MRAAYTISQSEVSLSAARPVRVSRMPVREEVAPHDHDYYEVCLVAGGRGVHETADYSRPLRRGAVVVVPPGGVHALRKPAGLDVINLYYLAEWLLFDLRSLWDQSGVVPLFLAAPLFRNAGEAVIPQLVLDEENLNASFHELTDLEAELEREQPSMIFLKSSLLKLFTRISRARAWQQEQQQAADFRPEVWKTLEEIERCVVEKTPPRSAELARAVRLSEDHLGRLFKGATGRTMNDYYQQRRVHMACNLLLNPEMEMADVVFTLGYADAPHFCRMFRRYTGSSPRAWRRQYMAA